MIKLNKMDEPFFDERYKKNLQDNFTMIEDALNSLSNVEDDGENSNELKQSLETLDKKWSDKLKRVTLGVDEETIKNVVEKILEERGVI